MKENFEWLRLSTKRPSDSMRLRAENRQRTLTKPLGALGRLEHLASQLAALQATDRPRVDAVHIVVFAADHGVATQGVSAYPQAVTGEMIRNFAHGGAAINVLARELGATIEIVNLGTVDPMGPLDHVRDARIGPGTANFVHEPAMRLDQLADALASGRMAVECAITDGVELFIGGEMGIGNTTAATALACAVLNMEPESLAGPGTGLDPVGLARKIDVIQQALARHRDHVHAPLEALRRLGGFEIAALVGSYVACAQHGLPALVDGFIATSAALVAVRITPEVRPWLLFAHASAEPGHRALLAALDAQALLDLGLRLGEGSGAAVAVPLLRMACCLHTQMATFADAGVSQRAAGHG
ncbi:MAG TPA: nicotinate-nucleotide--dimethylbenzimidazole phosphoribosyltransferase [Burkholderiales bacterium]